MYPGKIDGTFKGRKVQIYPPLRTPPLTPNYKKKFQKRCWIFFLQQQQITEQTASYSNGILLVTTAVLVKTKQKPPQLFQNETKNNTLDNKNYGNKNKERFVVLLFVSAKEEQ